MSGVLKAGSSDKSYALDFNKIQWVRFYSPILTELGFSVEILNMEKLAIRESNNLSWL